MKTWRASSTTCSKELQKIEPDALRKELPAIMADSREDSHAPAGASAAPGTPGVAHARRQDAEPRSVHRQPHRERQARARSTRSSAAISRFARSSTSSRAAARTTPFSPAKPASARPPWSKASRCASPTATCRPRCATSRVRTLDLALLQAGAGVKGEFENRLKGLIDEVKSSPTPIILFIDEAHTMIGAGGAGRPERRRQPAQAGAGSRRTAHHRRHHLVGVQEVLREGCGAGPPLPGGQGGRAHRSAVHSHAARHRPRRSKSITTCASSMRAVGRGEALAPLSGRPPVARQGRQRARYRLRAPLAGPEHHSAADRRCHPRARRSRRADPRPRARSRCSAPITASGWKRIAQAAGSGRGPARRR